MFINTFFFAGEHRQNSECVHISVKDPHTNFTNSQLEIQEFKKLDKDPVCP
jgi:hypothetical protein